MKRSLTLERKIPPLSLKKNFIWTFVGNSTYVLSQWGIIVSLAKFGSALDVGRFTLGLAITSPVIMLMRLQLRGVQATDQRSLFPLSTYFTLRFWMMVLSILVIVMLSLVAGYRGIVLFVILLVGAMKVVESMSDVLYGCLQKYERLDKVAISMIMRGGFGLILFSLSYIIWRNLVISIVFLSISWLFVLLTHDLRETKVFEKVKFNGAKRELLKLALLSLPLGIVLSLVSLNTNIPRYLVEHFLGTEALGFFGALYYVTTAFKQVVQALGQASTPRLARYFLYDRRAFIKLVLKLLLIVISLGVLSMAFAIFMGERFLRLVYSGEYATYGREFNVLMLGASMGFLAIIMGYTMTAQRVFRAQPYLFLSVTVLTFTFGIYLIPEMGLLGAAYAVLASNLLQFLGSAFIVFFTYFDKRRRLVK